VLLPTMRECSPRDNESQFVGLQPLSGESIDYVDVDAILRQSSEIGIIPDARVKQFTEQRVFRLSCVSGTSRCEGDYCHDRPFGKMPSNYRRFADCIATRRGPCPSPFCANLGQSTRKTFNDVFGRILQAREDVGA
jgi:hypothetical protein